MVEQIARNSAKYLYTIVADTKDRTYNFSGIAGSPVYTISNGEIAAVVSDIADKKIRPERRNLAAHQEVLKHFLQESTPLPVSFGIIANDKQTIQRILTHNQDEFIKQLQHVAGKIEMGLRVRWAVANIFEYFVKLHTELKVVRNRLVDPSYRVTQQDKIEIGRMFEQILNERREDYTTKVAAVLSPHCCEIKCNLPRNEYEIMNLVCLVSREAQAEFEISLFEAANYFDNNIAFDYNGPWAPHNFVSLNLKF
ncbi:MAG: GvpL/GvpF family gas vesicle protein [Acidobacteriota bacterium]